MASGWAERSPGRKELRPCAPNRAAPTLGQGCSGSEWQKGEPGGGGLGERGEEDFSFSIFCPVYVLCQALCYALSRAEVSGSSS